MTSPAYGYLHRGVAVAYDEDADGWTVRVAALAPGRTMGPFPTMAAGVAAGERVLLASVGTSRDDLVILGRVPPTFPDIGDIPGLVAALAAKADDSEITAINLTLGTLGTTVGGHTTTLGLHTADLADLKRYDHGFATPDEYRLYGGKLASVPRYVANGTVLVDNTTRTRVLMMGMGNPGEIFTGIRFAVTAAVAAATANYGVFWGTSPTSMARQATGSFSVAATGEIATAFAAPITVPSSGGPYYIAAMLCTPSATPSYATLGVPSGLGQGLTSIRMIGFDAGTSVPAGPINLSTAGPYSASSSRVWMELY